MKFRTFGAEKNKSLLFIHGMASTAMLCYEPLLEYLQDYHVILCEVDGHCEEEQSDFVSVQDSCDKIERYVQDKLGGKLYALSGFSMGGTMAVDLIGRGNIRVERTHLDAAFTVQMGLLKEPYKFAFSRGIGWMQKGRHIPKCLMDSMMGKDNNSVNEILYQKVSRQTLLNACESIYTYSVPAGLKDYRNPVMFWMGEHEPYPQKSARILKEYLPQLETNVFPGMGHGQYLHEHPKEYAEGLRAFLE